MGVLVGEFAVIEPAMVRPGGIVAAVQENPAGAAEHASQSEAGDGESSNYDRIEHEEH